MAPENERSFDSAELIVVERLRLASWLYVNHQRLVERKLDSLGQHISYYFEASEQTEALVEQWVHKRGVVDLPMLAKYSESVSFEIRIAARMRRGEDTSKMHAPRRTKIVARAVGSSSTNA
jgi:hypothetical protein